MFDNDLPVTQKIAATLYASRREKVPYTVTVLNKPFVVFPGVFSPKYCLDTAFYAENLPASQGKSILEVGCGTGIISIFALLKGANSVVGVDINPLAVDNSIENAKTYGVFDRMDIRLGNVYDALKPNERFDLVFWNTPFGYSERNKISLEEMSLFDPGYKAFNRFISGSKNHLNKSGKLLFGCCPELARFDLISETLASEGLSYLIAAQMKTAYLGVAITFALIEAHPSGIPETEMVTFAKTPSEKTNQ